MKMDNGNIICCYCISNYGQEAGFEMNPLGAGAAGFNPQQQQHHLGAGWSDQDNSGYTFVKLYYNICLALLCVWRGLGGLGLDT